jgi:Domain of unknown function (DUF3846)
MAKVIVIPVEDAPYVTEAETLADLQALVDGYIEIVPGAFAAGGKMLLANEDGISMDLPLNRLTEYMLDTRLYGQPVVVGGLGGGVEEMEDVDGFCHQLAVEHEMMLR